MAAAGPDHQGPPAARRRAAASGDGLRPEQARGRAGRDREPPRLDHRAPADGVRAARPGGAQGFPARPPRHRAGARATAPRSSRAVHGADLADALIAAGTSAAAAGRTYYACHPEVFTGAEMARAVGAGHGQVAAVHPGARDDRARRPDGDRGRRAARRARPRSSPPTRPTSSSSRPGPATPRRSRGTPAGAPRATCAPASRRPTGGIGRPDGCSGSPERAGAAAAGPPGPAAGGPGVARVSRDRHRGRGAPRAAAAGVLVAGCWPTRSAALLIAPAHPARTRAAGPRRCARSIPCCCWSASTASSTS